METVYLKNGQKVQLVKEIDGQYLVNPYEYYLGYEGEEYEELSGSLQLVDKVFKTAPLPSIDEEYKNLTEQINNTREEARKVETELYLAKNELTTIQNTVTDASKYIINRENIKQAKRISYFEQNHWTHTDWQRQKSAYDLKINAYISIYSDKEEFWAYKLYEDYNSSSSLIDSKYGLLLDKTDEELELITKERIAYYEKTGIGNLYERQLTDVDDKFLSEKLIEKKNSIISEENEKNRIKTEKEIADLTEKLERLKTQGGTYPTKGKKK